MKKCLIIANTGKENSKTLSGEISEFLEKQGIGYSLFNFDGFSVKNPVKGYDFIITLGGDGTVLFAARCAVKTGIPVFPVNLGEFGFIAGVQPEEWKEKLEAFLSGNAPVAERSLVKACVYHQGKKKGEAVALNDIAVSSREAVRTINLEISYNKTVLCQLKTDGAIFSTPTGSTAYSAAAGGPIIDPELDALVFTPVNPFSLSTRPIVLNPEGEISVTVLKGRTKEINVYADGQRAFDLEAGDLIKIRRNSEKVRLVYCTGENFYNALRSKLNWSGGPHA